MKIAISTDGSSVSAHFGRCPSFTILEVEGGKLKSRDLIANPGHHPGYLPEFLKSKEVECIVAGGMGMRARGLFDESGIQTILGVSGSINNIVSKIVEGKLSGGESLCRPGDGKDYGIPRTEAVIEGRQYSGRRKEGQTGDNKKKNSK
ncbi:MAG: NifB/NifX family molybdenum-iron cluster-binding protein [Elusimicrobiota bacterium]